MNDNVGVERVTWSNNRGGSGTATILANGRVWSAKGIALKDGQNVITVTAYDAANNWKSVSLTVTKTKPEDKASFVSETVKDGTSFSGGSRFTKTWTIKNQGNTTWNTNYKLRHVSGALSTNRADVRVSTVPPGGTFTFRVPMQAPTAKNSQQSYREDWQLVGPNGLIPIGSSNSVWALIQVPGKSSKNPATEKISTNNAVYNGDSLSAISDPIDTSTGAHVIERTLLNVNGVVALTFRLNYSSLLLEEGPVGKGWGHHYQTYLEETSNNAITVYWTKNRYNHFTSTGNRQYTSTEIPARFDVLIKNADGTFTLTRQDQSVLQFNRSGLLMAQQNRKGQVVKYGYDGQNRLTIVMDIVSTKALRFAYHANGLLATVTDPLNRQVKLAYDSQKHLTSLTDTAGQTTAYTYNAKGQVLTAKDAKGVVIFKNTYDDKGRVMTQDDAVAGNQLTRFQYDETSQQGKFITTVTNRNGATRVFTHSDRYQLLSIKDELGKTIITSTYDAKGNLASATDANGRTTRFTYNNNGLLLSSTDAAGNVTRMAYDSQNNLLSITNALGKQIRFAYDARSNLISITDPLGKVTT
ncbi:MAG TPA: hypothetical protein EYP59_06990, partial [Thiotrichaceae bacterium]|nr:hypothetical protein [Thiotrichaceae bacterium]